MNKIINAFIIVLTLFVVYIVCLLVYPYKVHELDTIEVLTPVVKAGGMLIVHTEGERFTDMPCAVSTQLINDSIILLPDTVSSHGKGKINVDWPVRVPKYAECGEYRLIFTLTFKVNPIRTITKRYETEIFKVIK